MPRRARSLRSPDLDLLRALAAVTTMVVLAGTGCSNAPPQSAAPSDASSPTVSGPPAIVGQVTLRRAMPAPERVRVDADPQCAALVGADGFSSEDVVIGDGRGLQHVFVHVVEGLPPASGQGPTSPSSPVVLDQQRCRYLPRVMGMTVGQPLIIRNSDPLLHTVRADAAVNARFNVATPVQGMEVQRRFTTPEVMVPIRCDMHPWMQAYVGVVAHPHFAVTGPDGRYSIAGLAPGRYVLEFWHERLGSQRQSVTVDGGAAAVADIAY